MFLLCRLSVMGPLTGDRAHQSHALRRSFLHEPPVFAQRYWRGADCFDGAAIATGDMAHSRHCDLVVATGDIVAAAIALCKTKVIWKVA